MDETFTRRELMAAGWSAPALTSAVRRGVLIRVRRGHYAHPDADREVTRAVRVGGRLACVSELRARGIWTPEPAATHVHLPENAARLRDPEDRKQPFIADGTVVLHWRALVDPGGATAAHVALLDALVQALRCLDRRLAIAAMDSALHQRLVTVDELRAAVAVLPSSQRALVAETDGRAESGLETIIRTLALDLGFRVEIQRRRKDGGRDDTVIEGWVIVETDGDAFHDVTVAPRDRRRDAASAADGRTTLRFRYAQVVYEQREVALAIIGVVRSHRRIRNSGAIADRALRRLESMGLA